MAMLAYNGILFSNPKLLLLGLFLMQFTIKLSQCMSSDEAAQATIEEIIKKHEGIALGSSSRSEAAQELAAQEPLEARLSGERSFIKDIVDRLHALDSDIGKLLFNSTSMYAPNDQTAAFQENTPKGGERFTEVLSDLDSLQDEIGGLINNATRTRQYNMLVRLRPLNTILYRIRHNLHLMRNSLVAINTVANLERLGNNVLDSTLQAFLKPDANATDELGDSGNYDIDLDKNLANNSNNNNNNEPVAPNRQLGSSANELGINRGQSSSTTEHFVHSTSTSSTTTTTTSTTTTTTPKPSSTTASTTTSTDTTSKPSTASSRSTRLPSRRTNNRQGQRRNTTRRAQAAQGSTVLTSLSSTTLRPVLE